VNARKARIHHHSFLRPNSTVNGLRVEYPHNDVAGETTLSKDEVIEWCKEWAQDKVYVTIGQNCWTMVHDFLEAHKGCNISEDLK
jgi:hypothetical protein